MGPSGFEVRVDEGVIPARPCCALLPRILMIAIHASPFPHSHCLPVLLSLVAATLHITAGQWLRDHVGGTDARPADRPASAEALTAPIEEDGTGSLYLHTRRSRRIPEPRWVTSLAFSSGALAECFGWLTAPLAGLALVVLWDPTAQVTGGPAFDMVLVGMWS